MEINMDFTTIQKTFETQAKIFADMMQPNELKDIQKKLFGIIHIILLTQGILVVVH
jgi:hypothetical protein